MKAHHLRPDLLDHGARRVAERSEIEARRQRINIEGVKSGDLLLDGPTLAKIFLGEIKTWNDPAITKLNPDVKLPAQAIAVVHRSDGSGTTFNFAYYLSEVSPTWKSKVGANTSVEWPVGIGAKGNEGVANNVAQTKGSIGYVEYAYAKQNNLVYTKMINRDGKTVAPTSATFQAAAAHADWKSAPGFGVILANQPGESWPMTAQVFRLGVREGRQDGRGARLHPDAEGCRRQREEDLGRRDKGRVGQADLRDGSLRDYGRRERTRTPHLRTLSHFLGHVALTML